MPAVRPLLADRDDRGRCRARRNHEFSRNFIEAEIGHVPRQSAWPEQSFLTIRELHRYSEAAVEGLEGEKRWPSLPGKPVVGPVRSARASWRLRTKTR